MNGRLAVRRLLPAVAALLLASCSKSSKHPIAPVPSTPTMETVVRSGRLLPPPNATVAPADLRVVTIADSASVGADGRFSVTSPTADKYQLLFLSAKNTGKPVYIALYDPAANSLSANDTSTALALTLFNPMLIYTTQAQRAEYLAAVRTHPRFGALVAALRAAYAANAANALDYGANPATYQLAGEIMHGTMVDLGAALAPEGGQAVLASPPYLEDVPGGDVKFVNPTHVWYGVGVYPDDAGRRETLSLDRRKTIVEFHWGWPPVVVTQPVSLQYGLGDGYFRLHLARGLDFSKFASWDDPVGRATALNSATGILYLIELVVGKIPLLSTLQLGTLPRYLHISASQASELGVDVAHGDVKGFLVHLAGIVASNAEELAYWVWQGTANQGAHVFIGEAASILKNVVLVFKILGFTNEQAPFFWDLFATPSEVTYYVTQSGGVLTNTAPDIPPVAAFTVFPPAGIVNTSFQLDAGTSHDDHDALSALRFRWDWESDGTWDIDWTADPRAAHAYAQAGAYTIALEVKDAPGHTTLAAHTVSVGGGRGTANHVKLFMDNLPWDSHAMTNMLASVGFTPGLGPDTYEVLPSGEMGTASLTPGEDLVIIANDQNQGFYDNYARNQVRFASFALGGGSIFWEASDLGWARGSMAQAGVVLPGNLSMTHTYDYYNFIRNASLPLVTGLPATMDHNYASHESFGNLPDGTTIYCVNSASEPTLIEFNYGDGWILVTGQPLEHQYDRIYGSPDMEQLLPRIVRYFTGRSITAPALRAAKAGAGTKTADRRASAAGSAVAAARAGAAGALNAPPRASP